ncbi:hypothetical protein E2562_033803 [Oryza meyeriana var. granulata]|uniref:Uncharacterized protein n=1 Tax=Oryza meyeriana var. granulata TaxID=110450 RepID=A0A6G1C195_9ORYZ|nr:hypothetical protein E2562_033803 [Oryza meyeriana var. granulata]
MCRTDLTERRREWNPQSPNRRPARGARPPVVGRFHPLRRGRGFWGWVGRGRWMGMGTPAVPPRAAGPRRYKALVPWRFQPGFVRQPVKPPAAAAAVAPSACRGGGVAGTPGAKGRGLGASGKGGETRGGRGGPQSRRCTRSSSAKASDARSVEKGGRRVAGNDGDLSKSGSNAGAEGSGMEGLRNGRGCGVGTAAGEDCSLGKSNPNGIVRDADVQHLGSGSNARDGECISEGLKKPCVNNSHGSSAADCLLKETKGNDSSKPDGAADESNAAVKGSKLAGPSCNGDETICKGRKAVAPWRFQIGYKRSFSKAFCSDSESSGAFVKGEKETATAYKKCKTDKDGPSRVMPMNAVVLSRENIMGSLRDFRLIYRELLDEEEEKSTEVVIRPDLQAYRIFRERTPVTISQRLQQAVVVLVDAQTLKGVHVQ